MGKLYRRVIQGFIAFFCCMLFAACGPEETVQPSPSPQEGEGLSFLSAGGGKGLEVMVERNDFYDVASELKGDYRDGTFLGMQFYQGEPVQLWASAPYSTGSGQCVTVYMYRQDGTRETCLEGIERFLGQQIFCRDSEGCYYSITSRREDGESIVKLDSAGKTLYTTRMDSHVWRSCELQDGRLAMLVYEGSSVRDFDIALLDTEGELTIVHLSESLPYQSCIGVSEEEMMLIEDECIYRVMLPEGKLELIFSFEQTNYSMKRSRELSAFCVSQNGNLELLWSDRQGSGLCENMRLAERDKEKEEVILRGLYARNEYWIKEQVLKFNSVNDRYRVVIEGPEEGDDRNDYITRTGVELATGKGPDILIDSHLIESPLGLIEKGGLVDLAPLMEQAGMKEEDYFPAAFDNWRMGDCIYSIRFSSVFKERLISSDVLGDMKNPDIEAVLDAMLAYPENAVYGNRLSAGGILQELLEGSETLWGMVDWENGTCDFGGELFPKLLDVAKRYQYDSRNNYPDICSDRQYSQIGSFYTFPIEEETRAEGNVPVGMLSDDGGHPVSMFSSTLSINANGSNKEGAWEFLQFLLSDEIQGSMPEIGAYMPVKKSVFWSMAEAEILNGPSKNYSKARFEGALPSERVDYIVAVLENVRALPYKTEAILEIVLEEAQDYFDGVKEIPQVVDAVENRVGLYLQERR